MRGSRPSLRIRLTVAAAFGMALALVLAGVVLVVALHRNLLDSVDTAARQRVAEVAALAEARGAGAPLAPSPDGAIVQILDSSGRVLVAAPDSARAPLSTGLGRIRSVSGPAVGGESDTYRVVAASVGRSGLRVAVAQPSDDVGDSIAHLIVLLLIGLPIVLVVLIGITWLLVGRALLPVEILRRQAATIAGQDLGKRVDVPTSGDELARLAETLNDLLARADEALTRQRGLVADAAHELRTPLATMLTRLDVQQRWPDSDGSASDVRTQVLRMSRLVDELLTLARLEARPPEPVPLDLDDVVLAELADARRAAESTAPDVHLRAAISAAQICGSVPMIHRVVRNLLDNALRYAQTSISVTLEVVPAATGATAEAVLVVADDGPGLAIDDAERVFDRFTRLDDSRDRDTGGAGLGLAIVREVVTAHGGRVAVEPADPGSRFRVTLPLLPGFS